MGTPQTKRAPASHPFPLHRAPGPWTARPSWANDSDARRAYEVWKETLVRSEGANGFRRVVRPDTPDGKPNSTVSEGISYGMLLSAYFDDQALFDDLWLYSQHWKDETGLMMWYIDPTGTQACPDRDECAAATDADEDIAFALILADCQWSCSERLGVDYRTLAEKQIQLVKQYEIDASLVVKPGNTWGGAEVLNLSYFAPAFYRVFGSYTDDSDFWNSVVDTNYEILFRTLNDGLGNKDNGLVPAWSNAQGEVVEAFPGALTFFQTDSIRTPFRLAQDWAWFGDTRARDYLSRISDFFAGIGADKISDGFDLDGRHRPEVGPLGQSRSAVFVACAAVGALSFSQYDAFARHGYELVASLSLNIRSIYYQLSWSALALLWMTGNYQNLWALRTRGSNPGAMEGESRS